MNNSTCMLNELTCPVMPTHISYVYLGIMLALGLPLNGLALWVFCCRLRRWTETHVYMVNLAAADLCLLCALPFILYSLKDRSEDTLLCQLSQSIYLANRYMSISLVMAIALDRYVAVRHPLCARRLRSPGRAAAVCTALWVLVIGSLVVRWLLREQDGGFCFLNQCRQNPHTVAFSLLGFYLPLAVLGFCSLQVVTALGQRPDTDSGQAEATRKATRMVWANLVVFTVCFLPLHVVLTWRLATGLNTCAISRALYVTSKISDANCCLDAICYYYMAKDFQEASALDGPPSAKAHKSQDSVCMTLS
ncbi:G-protein coupled receptor 35 [Rhinolophus sinicus]|uniref:G-protein coupled receptor 35 n=1 Tax=Rhinolophus sinicus TaxID=89399 RepID=UPI000943CA7D|nr:PREDICTED: G-protein coupled receptor 35 [Rhinolophus sinicus]XP_019567201.1 PREDICTED: G-protein coupled receptor 35 [Rhinolophus sinicus]XP_019567202.1 PREDICTED: G-protein coupled receptor 35 [Rhinolophus sinicus]XP_019567203.1 PREDICTED: G-protein coupled receptor 35 [Rhinolophus sinicus]XP_019567204.1 PREDICTED: G-protein coupled receptor 35 [Rhinolophus sinicus]